MARRKSKSANRPAMPPGYAHQMVGQPRSGVRGMISKNTRVRGNATGNNLFITATQDGQRYVLDARGNAPNDPVSTVSTLYNTYKYLPGTTFHYVPAVGVTSSGNVHVAYVDNPELIAYGLGLTLSTAAFNTFVLNQANCKTYPIWQSFTYTMPTATRRKMFDVNNSTTYTADENDRSVQGMFVISVESPLTSTLVGRPFVHKVMELEGLQGTVTGT